MQYDIAVIGGGAAGLGAVEAALHAGASVVLITDGPIGGDCTFTGCVPSKTLIEAGAQQVPFTEAMTRVQQAVTHIAATETADVLRGRGIAVIEGSAEVVDARTIAVAGNRIRAKRIVIATGSTPAEPPVAGHADVPYLTTDTVFDLTTRPDSLLIMGSGAVGCELAQALSRFGVKVSVVEKAPRLLPTADPEASAVLADVFAAEGIAVYTGTTVAEMGCCPGGVMVRTADGATLTADLILVAVGRKPVTRGLNLSTLGLQTSAAGHIVVDRHMATGVAGVYAAGDVTGRSPFTHAAHEMGRVAVGSALHRYRRPSFDPLRTPSVVFTDPEIAAVGWQEHEVRDDRARVAYLPLQEVDRAITAGCTRGFVKLLAGPRPLLGNAGGGRILGATIVGPRAGELIHEPAMAMWTGMFTGRLAQVTHAYPTWSTAVQQAAAQFFGYGERRPRAPRTQQPG